ncbi:MAG: urease accessory protein [Gammaproteobacteria bacterium]
MQLHEILYLLTLGLGLGMIHALDADHIMAVTGLVSGRPSRRIAVSFCFRWAMGHGMSLMAFGIGVYFLGMALPTSVSAVAERAVGGVLIAIGLWVLWDLWGRGAHLHFHRHDDLPKHAHWHEHTHAEHAAQDHHKVPHRHGHKATMVGLLHGTAGSAPLLAIIPVSQHAPPWVALAYLLIFSFGVLLTMLAFGGVLGTVFHWLGQRGQRIVPWLRGTVAFGAMGLGVFWLVGG